MKGISVWRIVRDQFYSGEAPPDIVRRGIDYLQVAWLVQGTQGLPSWQRTPCSPRSA